MNDTHKTTHTNTTTDSKEIATEYEKSHGTIKETIHFEYFL